MSDDQKNVPRWILALSWFFALLEMSVSVMLVMDPQSVVERLDRTALGVDYVVSMWAARQFALGCIFAFAAFRRSVPMLTIAYLFFLVMFLGDLAIGIVHHENGLIAGAIVMSLLSAFCLYFMNKKPSA